MHRKFGGNFEPRSYTVFIKGAVLISKALGTQARNETTCSLRLYVLKERQKAFLMTAFHEC